MIINFIFLALVNAFASSVGNSILNQTLETSLKENGSTEEKEILLEEFLLENLREPSAEKLLERRNSEEENENLGKEVYNIFNHNERSTFARDEKELPDEHALFSPGIPSDTNSQCKNVNDKFCEILLLQTPNCGSSNRKSFLQTYCPKSCGFCGNSEMGDGLMRRLQLIFPNKRERIVSTTKAPTTPAVPWWQRLQSNTQRKPIWRPRQTPQLPTPLPTVMHKPHMIQNPEQVPPSYSGDSKLVKITIVKHNLYSARPSYKFIEGDLTDLSPPWQKIYDDSSELSSFSLFRTPSGIFNEPIVFCSATDSHGLQKWSVTRNACDLGWHQQFLFFGAKKRSKSSILYFVGKQQAPVGSSIVSRKYPESGYRSGIFIFYGPNPADSNAAAVTPRTFTTRQYIPPTPATIPSYQRYRYAPSRPISPVYNAHQKTKEMNAFNRECLNSHNFFRAIHNVPPLKWSADLAKSAQKWADELKTIAPERPTVLLKPERRTSSWPHSEIGSEFRHPGHGENIAWDLSSDGSSAKESTLRFYNEIFYYNRKHPTYSIGPNYPVGHVTQLLWKDTTHVGCGVAVSRFSKQSTWTVMHYSPAGNRRDRTSAAATKAIFDTQVPEMRSGSCMTKTRRCNKGNQCMAIGPELGNCRCTAGKPICQATSTSGCIAWCENKLRRVVWKDECQGKRECKCSSFGAVCI